MEVCGGGWGCAAGCIELGVGGGGLPESKVKQLCAILLHGMRRHHHGSMAQWCVGVWTT